MWFSKKSGGSGAGGRHAVPEGHLITADMLVKGTVSMRRGKPIRQIGVTVQGSTVLVTTGDIVDDETYKALLEMNAIRPPDAYMPPPASGEGR